MVTETMAPNGELKIVFTGPVGAGKTTAIRCIGGDTGVGTEVPMSEGATANKRFTTVGFDYGECQLDDEIVLRLYGTPGQERFGFMWEILAHRAFGLVVLADNSRPDPIAETQKYLQAFAGHVPPSRTVVGVGRLDDHRAPSIDDYCDRLSQAGFDVPVIEVDVRREADVRLLLSVLVSLAEVEHA